MASKKINYSQAIQIVTSSKNEVEGGKNNKTVIKIVEKYENGPSLANVLCDNGHKNLPMFVFSVTGKTRGGKSFLLNLAAKYLESKGGTNWMYGRVPNVFEWKGGVDSITKGLWMCPKIYKARNSKGKEVGILLLDNQGLFDGEQTEGLSVAMSLISTSISHYQMYNIKDKITTENLESIWRHLVEHSEDEVDQNNPCLLFVVRDYLDSEKGCGLAYGQRYIDGEKHRGSQENRSMWESLLRRFPNVKCLPLPHPGNKITKSCFTETGDLSVLEEEFMLEVDKFFKEVFNPKNLNVSNEEQHSNTMTGESIFNKLMKCDGTVVDDSLSFINIFTEHGNEDKLSSMKSSFMARLQCYSSDPTMIAALLNEFEKTAKKRFKGNSATDYQNKFEMFMVQNINKTIEKWMISKYQDSIMKNSVQESHKIVWPSIRSLLNLFVGPAEAKQTSADLVVKKAADIYYEKLSLEMNNKFRSSCENKTFNELAGYDNVYVSNNFKWNCDFNLLECEAIWLKHKLCLQEGIQWILVQIIATQTQTDVEWLQSARKQQYEYFEALTWENIEHSTFHWCVIDKGDERLKSVIGYAIFKEELRALNENQLNSIQSIAKRISDNSPNDPIQLSLIFVVYPNGNMKNIHAPVFKVDTPNGTVFVDTVPRVYKNWGDFMDENKLPDCLYCYPLQGEYNKEKGLQVGFSYSPASGTGKKILAVLDKVCTTLAVSAVGLLVFATAAPVIIGGTIVAAAGGGWGLYRAIHRIVDKVSHDESVEVGDVVDTVGSSMAVLSAGATAAVAALLNSGRELAIITNVVKGLNTATGFILPLKIDPKNNIDKLLREVTDVSLRMLFYFNSKSGEDTFKNIRDSYFLEPDVPYQEVLKALVYGNSIETPVEIENRLEVEQFLSTGFRTLVLDLLKHIDSDAINLQTTFLQPENETFTAMIQKLFEDFQIEISNFSSAILNIFKNLSSSEDFKLLEDCIRKSKQGDKIQFAQLLRHLIYSISGRMTEGNRLYNSIKHEGHLVMGYNGVEFHPVEEVLQQIDSTAIIRKGSNILESLDKRSNKKLCSHIKKLLKYVCKDADDNWNLRDFNEHLMRHCFLLSEIYDYGLSTVGKLLNQSHLSSCYGVNSLLRENGVVGGLVSCLIEKSIEESRTAVTRADHQMMGAKVRDGSASIAEHQMIKAQMCDDARSGTNIVISPAWDGLVNQLYCYSLIGNSQKLKSKELVSFLTKKPMMDYEEEQNENMSILKSQEENSSSYYVYRSQIDGEECGLIFIE